jgi:glucokinase
MDVGGTNLRFALVRQGGQAPALGRRAPGAVEIVRRDVVPTGDKDGREAVMGRIVEAVRIATGWADEPPIGVGMALAGPVHPDTGVMFRPPNLMSFDGFSPMTSLAKRLGVRAVSGNDATLAALAEHRYGPHGRPGNLVYLTLSTGVGGGQVVDGELYTGSGGFAGEWGHVTLDPDGPECNCGNRGDLESYCSGPSVARDALRMLDESRRESALRQIAPEALTAKDVNHAARKGDALALAVWERSGRYLGISLAGILNAVDPDLIVIGGGVSNALDLMMPAAERECAWRSMEQFSGRLPVVRAALDDDSALLGAAALAFQRFG